MAVRAILFDCDGVLFESDRANVAFFDAVLERAGLPPLDAAARRMATVLAGSQLIDAVSNGDAELNRRLRAVAREVDYTPFFDLMTPVPGLFDVLGELNGAYRLAMATNRGSTVGRVVERFGLGPYLDVYVGVLDVPRPKPFPDMLERCIETFAIEAGEAVYVGDSPTDYEAARAARVGFVGVGPHTGAAVCIAGLPELPQLLARRGFEPPPA